MGFRSKCMNRESLLAWREAMRLAGRQVAVTNGCFDLLHLGHATYLEQARAQADALLVGVNGDASVRRLKGPGRPLNGEEDRALVVAALESVSAVHVFAENRATRFLELVRPDVYVKGGDYTVETLDPEERGVLEQIGARIVILPFLEGRSTSGVLERMQQPPP